MKASTSTSIEKGSFPVAVKVLLRDKNKLLVLHDVYGDWDLPGGRILPSEFGSDITAVIARKLREELGGDIRYRIDGLDTYFQVERIEHDTGNLSQIFGLGFTACYLGGEISLGAHHDTYKWADMENFSPSEYFKHGWDVGIERYLTQQGFNTTTASYC